MSKSLQKAPKDAVLRKKIIRLAAGLRPALGISEEVERQMQTARVSFRSTRAPEDFEAAVKEFELVALAAPWYGSAYFNLGMAQDRIGRYDAALQSLELARLASYSDSEIDALIREIKEHKRLSITPEGKDVKEENAMRIFVAMLEGARFDCGRRKIGSETYKLAVQITDGKVHSAKVATGQAADGGDRFAEPWFEPGSFPLQGRHTTVRNGDAGETSIDIDTERLFWEVKQSQGETLSGECHNIN